MKFVKAYGFDNNLIVFTIAKRHFKVVASERQTYEPQNKLSGSPDRNT